MKLEQSFEVAAPVERVWQALIDVERVAPCLPGAAVTGRNDDGTYNGTFTIKIGPTTAAYAGKLAMEEVDEGEHRATMQANGTDKRGQGGAKATIVSSLSAANGGTRVEVSTDYHITGRLARFGRGGMIEDISQRLLREFAQRLQESLTEGGPAAPSGAKAAPAAEEPDLARLSEAPPPPAQPSEAPTPEARLSEAPPPPAEPSEAPPEARLSEAPPPEAQPSEAPPPEALDAGALVRSVAVDRIRRNPIPVALAVGFLLAILLRRRAR